MSGIPVANPLSPELGVIVGGFDIHADLTAAACDSLRRMLAEHHLILFRGVDVSPVDNRRLLEIFGPVEDEFQNGTYYSLVQNLIFPGREDVEELMYHCDYSFLPNPLQVVSLYGMDVPSVCANTSFANGVRACRTLPPDLRAQLEGRMVLHACDIVEAAQVSSGQLTDADLERGAYRGTLHPVILMHPRTGDQVLFINPYLSVRIEGLSHTESQSLLNQAFTHLYTPENVYEHCWRQGDFIIFDNIALTHKRNKGTTRTLRRMIVH